MHVVEVIPLVRGTFVEALSYYSSQRYDVGAVIMVPIRKQARPAVVIRIQPASTAKTALRAATFTLRKLPEQANTARLPTNTITLAHELTKHIPAEVGAILYALLPKEVREGAVTLHDSAADTAPSTSTTSLLTAGYEDRFRSYRSRIRETFAHRGSVLFVVPTSADVARAQAHLEKGIENRIVTFSTAHTKKKLTQAYRDLEDLAHAKLVITTPSHAFVDRHDFTQIIIDQSRSRAYKSRIRPYLDIRQALTHLARLSGRAVLLGDLVPRTEDEVARAEERYETEGDAPKRITLPSTLTVLEAPADKLNYSKFELFLPPVVEELNAITSKRKNIFMYAARRGIAPVVACDDCGYVFRCPDSGAPYTLFKTNQNGEEKRWFLAAASGRRLRAADTCPICNSWRLREHGIGIQHIERELKQTFPQVPVILFDHTTATNYKKAARLIDDFYHTKGAILLGTAMAMPYLEKPVPYSIITSLDAARAIPTWRAEEELFSLLLHLREKTTDVCYIQTRTEVDEVVKLAQAGQIEAFYKDEIELRESLHYPPFVTLVHLTLQGTAPAVAQLESELAAILLAWKPRFYHAPTTTKAKATRYGLLRIPQANWPDQTLMDTLRSLPPQVRIEINPDRIV